MSLEKLKRDLADLTDEDFELLVFQLVQADEPSATKLANPDGGADIIAPGVDGAGPHVRQVKRYPDNIWWNKCEKSLDQAVKTHKPARVTFVFPRDLSAALLKKFDSRLRNRRPGVVVDYIGLSDLHVLVERHPEVAARAFERIRNDALRAAQRQIAQGGQPLETGLDFVQRATELSKFGSEQDLHFHQRVVTGEASTFEDPVWNELPFMTMKALGGDQVIRVDFFPREGVEVPPATWSFTDNEAGRVAFEQARERLARGEEARISDSIVVHAITTPNLLRELGGELAPAPGQGAMTLQPSAPTPLRLEIETDDGEIVVRELEVRSVLPRTPGYVDFVGVDGQLRVELELRPGANRMTRLHFSITASSSSSASANAAAWAVLDAFGRNKQVTLHAPEILPAGGLSETTGGLSKEAAEHAYFMRRLAEDIVTIEERVGQEIPIPDQFEREDLAEIANAVHMIETGEGTGSVTSIEFIFTPDELAKQAKDLETGPYEVKRPVRVKIFGRTLTIGEADMHLPPMKIVSTQSTADHPQASLRVKVVPAVADPSITFKITPPTEPSGGNGPSGGIIIPTAGEVLDVLTGKPPAR